MSFHREGLPAFEAVLAAGHAVACAFTLTKDELAKRSAPADYGPACRAHGVALHRIDDVNGARALELLAAARLDYLFVIGWSQILRAPALAALRRGAIGAHASLLPRMRGSAPINWALIRGERATGNTLIWLSGDVDAGDVIDQREIAITPFDTCATLYDKVAATNREMILDLWPRLATGGFRRDPQPPSPDAPLPRRRPSDGRIDWSRSARELYDFVRALTRPYPGAFGELAGRTWLVWRAALLPEALAAPQPPGTIVGPLACPDPAASGICVATGMGALALLEIEERGGRTLAGHELALADLQGQRFAP
jgi:methionyl-tRNA formyltransferase